MNWASDIDGVASNFGQAIINKACELGWGCDFPSDHTKIDRWMFSGRFMDVWNIIEHDENFWLNIPAFEKAREAMKVIPAPAFYITKRPVSSELTATWLENNNFPNAPVITVDDPEKKLEFLITHNLDAYVDDLVSTIRQVRAAGVNGVLYEATYQATEDITGLPIIKDLRQLPSMIGGV